MQPQYLGLMIIVTHNKGGTYIICDLNGTLAHTPVAAFRVVLYLVHDNINISDLKEHIDISVAWLCELEYSTTANPNDPDSNRIVEIIESNSEDNGSDGT